ncbi:MAG: hypothetical protein E4G99_04560 [Anaerolineales bacterium]|nr:MAG: hypothetical protein E4G99_04560 [Anaerolineales bacterium]
MGSYNSSDSRLRLWSARGLILSVFCANLTAAIPFIINPERFLPGFELSGLSGEVSVRGLGIVFLMWNATFPPVIFRPDRYRVLFSVMLAQQVIGLLGEILIWLTLPAGHAALQTTGLRFILFDGLGLLALLVAFLLTRSHQSNH